TTTAYIESSAGVEDGGRTGLTALVVAALFLLSLFLAPLAQTVPPYATAPRSSSSHGRVSAPSDGRIRPNTSLASDAALLFDRHRHRAWFHRLCCVEGVRGRPPRDQCGGRCHSGLPAEADLRLTPCSGALVRRCSARYEGRDRRP